MALGPTVLDIALSILAATASDAGPQLATRWINERYVEFVGRARTHQLRHYASVFVPAPLTGGTISVTQGSNTAVGTGTAFTSGQVGWQFRSAIVWYTVLAINVGTQTLTLDSAFSEQTNTAAGYQLVERYIPTVPDCRWISNWAHPRMRRRLKHATYNEMTQRYPSRQLVGAFPWIWTEVSRYVEDTDLSALVGTAGQKMVEVYPPSSVDETYTYEYWSVPSTLTVASTLPPEIDEYVLREGVLVDVYRYKSEQAMRKAMDTGNMDFSKLAEIYTNKESRQRTVWEQCIQDGQVADAAYHNEVQVELQTGMNEYEDGDIINAHQNVIYSWTM